MFDVIAIPAFKDNYVWLLRHDRSAVVVDPGDAGPVIDVLDREGLALAAVLVTHHHVDHQGGIAELLARDGAEVFGPADESITGLSRPLHGGESIRLDALGTHFDVLAVPGHTLGQLAYFGDGCLFCGDTLFGAGCGRLFEGTPAQMHASLSRLATLPDETRVYAAHEYTEGNLRFALAVEPDNPDVRRRMADVARLRAAGFSTLPSTVALEKATNPFLRCDQTDVMAAARSRFPSASTPAEVFAVLREWKNTF